MPFITKRAFYMAVLVFIFAFSSLAPAADRPPLVGIAHIALQVSDLAKAQAFYGGLLGYDERLSALQRRPAPPASCISK
jgi:hypothetical protein